MFKYGGRVGGSRVGLKAERQGRWEGSVVGTRRER